MGSKSTELAAEQAYFDLVDKHRERHRAELNEAPSAAANPGAAQRLRNWVRAKRDPGRPGQDAVAFGRIDNGAQARLYIGNEMVTDDNREVLVVNWQAPAAAPYYQATVDNPLGLVRKRSFVCAGNTITDFADVIFQRVAEDVTRLDGPDARLLSELDQARDGALRSIVATIQAAQYELVQAPIEQTLVIEGGPGTGKTAVALHRVSWLLYNYRDRLGPADVLVVGPNPAFTRYVRTVLPELGDTEVEHTDIGQLAPRVPRGRPEPVEVRRLKGDERMAALLARALEARIGGPDPAERMLFEGRYVTISGVEVQSVLTACREAPAPYAQRRGMLRSRLLLLARERGAPTDRERLEPVENLVDRLWPLFSAPAFLRELFGSKRRLAAAAGTAFTAAELALLQRRGADRLSAQTWSDADLPLLDELEELINGPPRRYRHIVVDEAQDLSPMQLRSIARRSATGSLTIVGDLAQSTGPWARDDWSDLLRHLPTALPSRVAALRYGYRVPRQVYELAARLLPLAAPGLAPLTVIRDGPAQPGIHRVEAAERPGRAVGIALAHAVEGRFVGLVCPPTCRQELAEALAANQAEWSSAEQGDLGAAINVVSPQEAKGLEFDAVIVIEPEDILAADERGHRMLFIALTRTTRYLDVVCVGDPLPLAKPGPAAAKPGPAAAKPGPAAAEPGPAAAKPGPAAAKPGPAAAEPGPAAQPGPPAGPALDDGRLDDFAAQIAAIVAGGAPAPAWYEILNRAAAILDQQAAPDGESGGESGASGRHRRG